MRKISTLLTLTLLFGGWVLAQQKTVVFQNQKVSASARPKNVNAYEMNFHASGVPEAKHFAAQPVKQTPKASGKTQTVNPVQLGSASNAFTILRTSQNQVYANDSLGMVGFIHRQDIALHGGTTTDNGRYRYDLSLDKGLTFTTNVGYLQSTYTNYGRFPQFTGQNTENVTDPLDAKFVFAGATNKFPTPGWIGHVYGVSNITTTSASISTTENYQFDGEAIAIPGGLTQTVRGKYFNLEWAYDGTAYMDTMYIYKGTYNSATSDVDWIRHQSYVPPHYKGFDGTSFAFPPDMGASPEGSVAWIGWLGDLIGGSDSVISPVFMKSTDGGETWGTPVEVNLETFPWIRDTLTGFWTDSTGLPVGGGRATCTSGFDITVDANGNPHMLVVIGNGNARDSLPGYVIFSGIEKFMADIYSTDGGTTWSVRYIAPSLAWQGDQGGPDVDGNFLTMDAYPQISRTMDGGEIFYSWADIDTTIAGFGISDLTIPNLRIAGYRVADGFITCWKKITDTDLVYDGKIICPTMSPFVIQDGTTYKLPVVFLKMLGSHQQERCSFLYLGNDAMIFENEFVAPGSVDLSFMGNCSMVNTNPGKGVSNTLAFHPIYPNPALESATLSFDLNQTSFTNLSAMNMFGEKVWTGVSEKMEKGHHELSFPTSTLAPGIYFIKLESGAESQIQRLVVVR